MDKHEARNIIKDEYRKHSTKTMQFGSMRPLIPGSHTTDGRPDWSFVTFRMYFEKKPTWEDGQYLLCSIPDDEIAAQDEAGLRVLVKQICKDAKAARADLRKGKDGKWHYKEGNDG